MTHHYAEGDFMLEPLPSEVHAQVIDFPVRIPEQDKRPDPLIVALYGGPGTGKSTTADIAVDKTSNDYAIEIAEEVKRCLRP